MNNITPLLPYSRKPHLYGLVAKNSLSPEDWLVLARAREQLENASFAARLANVVGMPIEMVFKLLPSRWYRKFQRSVESVISRALHGAVMSLEGAKSPSFTGGHYKWFSGVTGALGGFIGGPALWVELPATTLLMLRAIAEIAREEGEDITTTETQVACLEVFALGGHSRDDDAADTGYYGLRFAMQMPINRAGRHIALYGLDRRGAPALVNVIARVSQRFGVVVSQKTAAELLPVIGAVGGAVVNTLFMQHFIDMARSHFIVRRLERQYSVYTVRNAYLHLDRMEKKRNHISHQAA